MNIGSALFLVDVASVLMAFFVIGPTTGLYSTLGLMAKSLAIDGVIENINQCKCFNIICDDPDPICHFIIHELHRSATVYKAEGAFTHHSKTGGYDNHEEGTGSPAEKLYPEDRAECIYSDFQFQ